MSIIVTSSITASTTLWRRRIQPGNPVEDLVHAGEISPRG